MRRMKVLVCVKSGGGAPALPRSLTRSSSCDQETCLQSEFDWIFLVWLDLFGLLEASPSLWKLVPDEGVSAGGAEPPVSMVTQCEKHEFLSVYFSLP